MRRQSRELALQILFQTEFAPQISYAQFLEVYETTFTDDVIDYADQLIQGVKKNVVELDQKIQAYSQNWKLERMALIDKNLLRMAVFEMKYLNPPVEGKVVINETLEIAKKFSTTESSSFINGLLDAIAKS